MSRSFVQDGLINSPSEFFLAKITAVGAQEGTGEDANYPCSWNAFGYYDSMRSLNSDDLAGYLWGDYTLDPPYNVAFPVSGAAPAVGDVVLMRLRGTREVNQNVFEFVSGGGGGSPAAGTGCLSVKSIYCNNGILTAVFSDAGGCISGCTSGIAYLNLNSKLTVPSGSTVLLEDWNLSFGDLTAMGLATSNTGFENIDVVTLSLKITVNYIWSPNSTVGSTRAGLAVLNNVDADIKVADFMASDNTRSIHTWTGFINLPAGDFLSIKAFQDSGSNVYLGDPAITGETTILIERLC